MRKNTDFFQFLVGKCLKKPFSIIYTKQGTGIICQLLTKKGSKAQVQVVGKAVYSGGGYGMEIPCVYTFPGQPRNVDMLNKYKTFQITGL